MENVDRIYRRAEERYPTLISSWLINRRNDLGIAKRALADTLRSSGRSGSNCQTEDDEAVTLLILMMEQPRVRELTLSAFTCDGCVVAGNFLSRENHIRLMAAKNGSISKLGRMVEQAHIDVLNRDKETPLHLVAEFEHVEDVAILLDLGATIRADKHGCTPLHSAAMAITPNAQIARLLVQAATEREVNFWLLNKKSNPESGENTALHLAAGNVKVTAEFIEELKNTDSRIQNAEEDTAYHVAAKSNNPNAIIYLLKTFQPTNAGWDIDNVNEKRDENAPSLVNMCASNGNAEAIALLIQHGADISGVLHEIVVQSVLKPKRMDKFLAVYQAVVDNVVTWRCLRENRKFVMRASSEYDKILRETMIYLTTQPYRNDKNMIERAIELGASDMLMAILNTDNVYKFDHFGVRKADSLHREGSYCSYDITDFVKPSTLHAVENEAEVEYPAVAELDFTKRHRPEMPYLEQLLRLHSNKWKNMNVLTTQPLRELTKPYIRFVQYYYAVVGLIQLMFVGFFSALYIPDTCAMADMFDSGCNVSSQDGAPADDKIKLVQSASRVLPSWTWLCWPFVVFIGSVALIIKSLWFTAIRLSHSTYNICSHDHQSGAKLNGLLRRKIAVLPIKMLSIAATNFPLISFSVSVFFWYYRHADSDDRDMYLQALALVFLFGWTVTFVLFSHATKRLRVFLMVLTEIIVKDLVANFALVFVATILGFSFALHTLRLKSETAPEVGLGLTVYDVFVTALGLGSFYEETREEMDNRMGLFRYVFAFYACFTSLILLSVLIAIMSRRYDDAKRGAEGVWRFRVIKRALALDDFNFFNLECCILCCSFNSVYDEDVRCYIDVILK